ncbi:unnamed protein product [Schistosoma curassoni]|uniref:SERPIN domain-containing protein n=1 Tax=Schistosoma curassoni TaxID=6186 RepID=A0A183JKM7_9TREM|nr:unnamed protein product [Schistosoma curassoni]
MFGVTKEDVTELLSFMLDADFNEQVLKCYPKNICRCSTLSGPLEFYGRQVATAAGFTFDGHVSNSSGGEFPDTSFETENGRHSLEKLRDDDCELIRRLNVTYICDFMLEYRKIKCWVPISSSEKVDQQGRYNDFVVIPLPYPGSEFFRIWRDSGYAMHHVYFDWNRYLLIKKLRSSEQLSHSGGSQLTVLPFEKQPFSETLIQLPVNKVVLTTTDVP